MDDILPTEETDDFNLVGETDESERDGSESVAKERYIGGAVSKEQFLSVLTQVKSLLIRAKYHTDQAETR